MSNQERRQMEQRAKELKGAINDESFDEFVQRIFGMCLRGKDHWLREDLIEFLDNNSRLAPTNVRIEQQEKIVMPPLDYKNVRVAHPEAQQKYGGNLTQYQGDFLIQRERQLLQALRDLATARENAEQFRQSQYALEDRVLQLKRQAYAFNSGGFADADAMADRYLEMVSELTAAREQIAQLGFELSVKTSGLSSARSLIARLEAEKAQAFNAGVEAAAHYVAGPDKSMFYRKLATHIRSEVKRPTPPQEGEQK